MATADRKTPEESAAGAAAAETAPQEDDNIREFRHITYWVLGEPRELHAVWKSTDSDGAIASEKAHLHIAPTFEIYPATADLPAMTRPAVDDPSESLGLGRVRNPESLPEFPIIPAKLEFEEKAQLSPDDLTERNRMEQAVLEQGVKYLIAVPKLLHMPDAQVLDITKGSVKNPPEETLHSSPTEVVVTVNISRFDTRTVRANVEMDGSVDLCVTDMIGGKETQRGGIDALADAKSAVESFFPGFKDFFQQKRPTITTPKPTSSDL